MQQHLWRIIESIIALVLLILTIVYWTGNQIGQNIINLEAVGIWIIGIDNIVIGYRWLINQPNFQYEVSIILSSFFGLGKLFEKFYPTQVDNKFNSLCQCSVLILFYLNLAFVLIMMLVLVLYCFRQIYRLMTETLLSTNTNLQPEELEQIMRMKKPFAVMQREKPDTSPTCSICLMQFQSQSAAVVILPVCEHCFHEECIKEWLQTKATCPYCRSNIRLSLL